MPSFSCQNVFHGFMPSFDQTSSFSPFVSHCRTQVREGLPPVLAEALEVDIGEAEMNKHDI